MNKVKWFYAALMLVVGIIIYNVTANREEARFGAADCISEAGTDGMKIKACVEEYQNKIE